MSAGGRRLPEGLRRALPYLGVVLGILVLASPVAANLIESWRAENTVGQTTRLVSEMPEDVRAELLGQAQAYNRQLATHEAADGVWPYERQLSWGSSPVMSWVEIPRINVRLGVYHGTEEPELMAGAGHLEMTSLPVGGESAHCVISAHSGMPTARMFDDIHDLVAGDVFVLWTLGEPYAYRVTGSEVVQPVDVSGLRIEQGRDLCTLVTCTPIGVNSQRLLVHAERCPYEEAEREAAPPMYVSPRVMPLVVGLVVAGGALAVASWRLVLARRRRS